MSVTKEPTVVVLMRFVITPWDPITALVNQDMKKTEIIAQVSFFFSIWSFCAPTNRNERTLPLLFFHEKMLFKVIIC